MEEWTEESTEEAAPRRPPAPPEEATPAAILVVDDDALTRTLFAEWLEERYAVATAADGFEALTALLRERPDLIVLDLVMPRVSGFEVLAALHRSTQSIPILVVSSRFERPGDRLGPLVLGAADILAKPVQRFELLHKIETLLRLDGPPPQLLDPGDAQALFGSSSPTRLLPAADFRDRLNRACDFGRRFGVGSALLALSAPSAEILDQLVNACDATLRLEDAVLLTSKRRALLLLVAAESEQVTLVIERIAEQLAERGEPSPRLRWRAFEAVPSEEIGDWRALFRDLEALPERGSG